MGSTSDGLGLAFGIAKHLVNKIRCFTLFASHFHELADLALDTQGVTNSHTAAHVDETTGELTFLYQIKPGATDRSYGLHVAKIANFPSKVVEKANELAERFEAECRRTKRGNEGLTPPAVSKRQKVMTQQEKVDLVAKVKAVVKESTDAD